MVVFEDVNEMSQDCLIEGICIGQNLLINPEVSLC